MIRPINNADILGLNELLPKEWSFDFEFFLTDYGKEDYFHAFVMVQDEKVIGTGNVFLKDKVGWLANIIIDKEFRGNGLGLEMTKFLVDFLTSKGCETQLLIATELGEPVYEKLGFKKQTEYRSFDTVTKYSVSRSSPMRKLEDSDLENLFKLDKEINGENREHFIEKYYKTGLGYFNANKELLGFFLPDFGRGLVLAKDKKVGIELIKFKHAKKGQKTLLPVENEEGVRFFENNGFKKGEKCSRMIFGKENSWSPEFIYSYGGGYCG